MIENSNFYSITKQIAPTQSEQTSKIKDVDSKKVFAKEMASAFHKLQNDLALKEQQRNYSYDKPIENRSSDIENFVNEKAYLFESTKKVYEQNSKLQGKKSYEESSATFISAPLEYKINYRPKQIQENPVYYNYLNKERGNPYNSAIKMIQAQKAYEPFKLVA